MANTSSKAKTSKTAQKATKSPIITEVKYRGKGSNPRSRENLVVFDSKTAKEMGKKGALTKQALAAKRKQIREDILAAMPEDARQDLWKAVRCGDVDKVKCYETVFRIVGSTFDQSEERVQNFKVNQNTQEKRSVVINFRKATPEDAK